MIVVLKRGAEQDKREQLINWLKNQGLGVHISEGEYQTVLGLIGDTARVDMDLIESLSIVDSVKRVTEPFKCCNRKFHPDDTVVDGGLASTLKELLMSAEYIMAGGNEQVILCERGIRTYDDYMRNTLDLAAVPMLKELTHLPVIVDPSHATGIARLVRPMALAAAACGSDGLIIEVHNDPIHALCDGAQSLRPEQYDDLAKAVRRVREAVAE